MRFDLGFAYHCHQASVSLRMHVISHHITENTVEVAVSEN